MDIQYVFDLVNRKLTVNGKDYDLPPVKPGELDKPKRDLALAAVAGGLDPVLGMAILDAESPKAGVGNITFKVSEKGALSVYGLQRMPVTLYVEQWERLVTAIPQLQAFAKNNNGKLSRKGSLVVK